MSSYWSIAAEMNAMDEHFRQVLVEEDYRIDRGIYATNADSSGRTIIHMTIPGVRSATQTMGNQQAIQPTLRVAVIQPRLGKRWTEARMYKDFLDPIRHLMAGLGWFFEQATLAAEDEKILSYVLEIDFTKQD